MGTDEKTLVGNKLENVSIDLLFKWKNLCTAARRIYVNLDHVET